MVKKILHILRNKYFIAIAFTIIWLLFFDRYDFISQYKLYSQLSKLRQEREYYTREINKNSEALNSLKTDSLNLEKFAREEYFMKKDNEDIFVIIRDTIVKSNESPK